MFTGSNVAPMWNQKFVEGKMFERMACDRCNTAFNFSQSPRVTRIPRCPQCGSTGAHTMPRADDRSAA
jgi:hypothetical protein